MLGDALGGSRAILTDKTHAIVRVTTISLESGEPRTLKHCKNTYKNERPKLSGSRSRTSLIHRQNPYRPPQALAPVWEKIKIAKITKGPPIWAPGAQSEATK